MTQPPMYSGDVVTFTFTITNNYTGLPVNMGLFGSVEFIFAGPGVPRGAGDTENVTLPTGGADGVCVYVTTPGEISTPGGWRVQAVGLVGGVEHSHSQTFTFEVLDTLG